MAAPAPRGTWSRRARQLAVASLGLVIAALSPLAGAAAAAPGRGAFASTNGGLAPASAECRDNQSAGTVKFASPFAYDASAGILDVYAALKLGYFRQLCLKVEFLNIAGGESLSLVSAGTAQITGEGSAADAMVAEAHSNFIGISTFGDTSDYALLTRKSITSLRQLQGKVLGYHTVLPVVLDEMLVKAGVDISKVKLVNDTSYDPLLLIHGPYDALVAYQSNEPITLRAAHQAFNLWTPARFGVNGTFNVQVVNRPFLAKHRSAVADFLRAELKAFSYCTTHGPQCVGFLAKASTFTYDISHAEQEWKVESALAEQHRLPGQGIGVQSRAEWAPEATAILRYKLVSRPVDLSKAQDSSLCASLYRGSQLIWP